MLTLLDKVVLEALSHFWVVDLRQMEEDSVVLDSQSRCEPLLFNDLRVVDIHFGMLLLWSSLGQSSLCPLDLLAVLSALSL